MKTISFYSYKGGVGRSLALAYTARYLAWRNIRVCILDIDLEAPGIVYKFPQITDVAVSKPGVVDYLNYCIHNGKEPDNINDYLTDVYPAAMYGYIKIMNAGKNVNTAEYWNNLSGINWKKLLFEEEGSGISGKGLEMFCGLIGQIEEQINPDYLFIDSRSGVTTTSLLCNSVLPDDVIMFLANNPENFHGSKLMYNHISSSNKYKVNKTQSKIYCAITRILPIEDEDEDEPETHPVEDESKIPKKLSIVDLPRETHIIDNFKKIVDNDFLHDNDITVVHSNRIVELNELYILLKDQRVIRSRIVNDYDKLIRKFVDREFLKQRESLVVKIPRYSFIQFDLHEVAKTEIMEMLGDIDYDEYQSKLNEDIKKSPKSTQLLYNFALCERYNKNIIKAAMIFSDIINDTNEDDKFRIYSLYWRGMMFLYDFNNYENAINDLEIVNAHNTSFSHKLYYHLAVSYYCSTTCLRDKSIECIRGKSTECIREKSKGVLEYIDRYWSNDNSKSSDFNSRIFLLSANVKHDMERCEEGSFRSDEIIADFDNSIELDPDFEGSYNCRGNYYLFIDEVDKALSDFSKAIDINNKYGIAYINRGRLFAKQGEIEKAFSDYNYVIELDLDHSDVAYKCRGDLYFDQGNIRKALSDYNKAIEINPENTDAYISREKLKKPIDYYKTLEVNLQYEHFYYRQEDIVDKYPFPMEYKIIDDGCFEFALVKNKNRIFLTDQGKTLRRLDEDRMFDLQNPELVQNLVAILREFKVFKVGADFSVEMRDVNQDNKNTHAIDEAKHRLLRCVSFINSMDIFYSTPDSCNNSDKYMFNMPFEKNPNKGNDIIINLYPFPTQYNKTGIEYEFALVRKDNRYFLSDQGNTCDMLDRVFELEEPAVQKNLDAILNECRVLHVYDELVIEIISWDDNSNLSENTEINKALYRLFACVSFMDTMRIFYV